MDNDGAHKFAFDLPEVFGDLMRLLVPEWVDEIDLDKAEEVSAAYVERLGAGFKKRYGDMLWRAPFKSAGDRERGDEGRLLRDGSSPYLLVAIEFQSTVDRTMAARARDYANMLRERLVKIGAAEREGGLPWVLPVVIYNGVERWTAPGEIIELAPLPSLAAWRTLAPFQQRAYILLSLERLLAAGGGSLAHLPAGNRVAATFRLQTSRSPAQLVEQLRVERERFAGDGNVATREALHAWADALLAARLGGGAMLPPFEELERHQGDEQMTTISQARLGKWFDDFGAERLAQGVAQGVAQGLARGIEQERSRAVERSVARLRRHATFKFGAAMADRVSEALGSGVTEAELDRIDDWIVECDSVDQLLARLRARSEGTGSH